MCSWGFSAVNPRLDVMGSVSVGVGGGVEHVGVLYVGTGGGIGGEELELL